MLKEIVLHPAVLSVGIGLGLVILGRVINDAWLKKKGESHADWLREKSLSMGRFISKYMGGKIGRKGWEKIEGFIQKCGLVYFKGLWKHGIPIGPALYEGLDEDDKLPPPELSGRQRHTVN